MYVLITGLSIVYFDSHLFGDSISSGIYNITWNPFYSEEYYYRYYDSETTEGELAELYDYYNPHIDKFRYLYISWADENAWEEWHTIESVNVNVSSFEVIFEWYDETEEEYQSIKYDQSLGEFEARNIAVETFYPYDKNSQIANFSLSQDYSNAQNLDIYASEGIFFNESSHDFDSSSVNIYASENLIEISSPSGFNLDDFETIIVYLNLTEGAYSDYAQFRLLDDAISNHPEAPTWTTNDSIYVDFEYNDIDYFLLVEDYMVGSEDSLFEYLNYTRNTRFVEYSDILSIYEVDKSTQPQTFDNFTKVNDFSSKLELHDFDMDCEHEIVIQKDDITRDGVYDSLKYGYVNPAGEITFHTLLQQATSTQIYTDKKKESKVSGGYQLDWKDIWRKYYIYVRREITTETLITNRIDTYGILIQKDLDGDGNADKEVMFDTVFTTTTVDTLTKEVTHFHWKPTVNNPTGRSHRGQLTEWRNSTTVYYDGVFSFTFKDFDGLEASSIRYYEDLYPNELSEVYNLGNYLVTITNDNNDDDPSNDVVIEAPNLEALLSISDSYDGVPAMFDHRTTIENGEVTHENLLATTKTIIIPDGYKAVSGVIDEIITETITVDVIEVVPEDGVYFDSSWLYSYGSGRTEGSYYYFDENGDGVFSTIFIFDSTDTLIGIGFDYDANTYFEPGKRQVVERHIICGKPSGWKKAKLDPNFELKKYYVAMSYADDKLVHFQDTDHYDGVFFEVSFGDPMFDIWKMEYSYGTSRLIEESQALTSDRFAESLGSRKWDDVWEQVETQLMALAISKVCGYVARAIAYACPYTAPYAEVIGYIVEVAAYMISYAIITAINAYIEKRDLDYYIRSQTFHNVDYEGEVTLSDKLSADDFDDDLMTHAFFGSESGVYAPIQVETDKHLYQGQIVLVPRGIRKTSSFSYTDLDVEFKSLTLDYSLQTRGYAAYSDYNDPRMEPLFFSSSVFNPFYDKDLPQELYNTFLTGLYMENSIMYLEDEISRLTTENHEEHYDTIMPYMLYGIGTFRPSLKFASSEGNIPLPEFYEEYPIFVPEEYYDEVKDEHHLIYKIFDGSTYEIQVVPEYSVHEFYSDIESIDVFLVGIQDDECVKCELKGTLYDDGYSFNSTVGVLTIDEEKFATFKTILNSEIESADYEPYLCLKLFVEKFRILSDNRTLISEEVGEIATMQSAQAKMLEYLYQFTIAEETQARLEEIEHTMFVTL